MDALLISEPQKAAVEVVEVRSVYQVPLVFSYTSNMAAICLLLYSRQKYLKIIKMYCSKDLYRHSSSSESEPSKAL